MNFARKSLAMVSILMGVSVVSFAQNKPTDIRPKHWATEAVSTVLNNKVMDFSSGTQFRGEAQVTRTEAVIALAKLAKCVETGTWKIGKIEPISGNAESLGTQSNWTKQPVTRFILAKTLASIGNYITKGVKKPAPNTKELAASIVVPAAEKIKIPASHPAYNALTYLTSKRLLWGKNVLFNPDNKPLQSSELSEAVALVVVGLNNHRSELGKDETGATPDKSFQRKK